MAFTVNRYESPLVSPPTICVVAVELNAVGVCATCPIHGVTTYEVIGDGIAIGASHDTVARPSPAVTVADRRRRIRDTTREPN